MTTTRESHASADRPSVVVAGHVCLDIFPTMPAGRAGRWPRAGGLEVIGPATLAVGGCVGNTGVALHRLGLRAELVARVGDDPLGAVLADLMRRAVPAERARLRATPGAATAYSLVWSRPGDDRAIQHFPGVNDTFLSADVPDATLAGAALLHVGYPPLMAAMVADDGRELADLLSRARALGLMTSVDMAAVPRDVVRGRRRWRALLERVLPEVDVLLPSLEEAARLLGRRIARASAVGPPLAFAAQLADELLGLGVAIAGVKLGADGLYVRTAPAGRLAGLSRRLGQGWADRELYSSVFETHVVGTTGAGDATVAGFLFGLLDGMSLEGAISAACAVGGSSTEAADGTSGLASWRGIEDRLRGGWRRRDATPGSGWSPSRERGLWFGVRDGTAIRGRGR